MPPMGGALNAPPFDQEGAHQAAQSLPSIPILEDARALAFGVWVVERRAINKSALHVTTEIRCPAHGARFGATGAASDVRAQARWLS